MDKTSLVGTVLIWLFILLGVTDNFSAMEKVWLFWNVPSIMIVVFGTAGCVILAFSSEDLVSAGKIIKNAFLEKDFSSKEIITAMVSFAEKARREGLLALEEDVERMEDPFLKKGIQLVVDGTDPELVKKICETEIYWLQSRHNKGMGMMETAATLAPAFGMIGTLIGLIAMLANLSDPDALGPGMSVALITTLYGSIIANAVFLPIASKLKVKSDAEVLFKKLMVEGLISIQAGDNPRIVEETLKSFLPPSLRGASSTDEEGDD